MEYHPADYRPVLFTAHPRSARMGFSGQANSVIHAQAEREIALTFKTRQPGEVLCGKKQGKKSYGRIPRDGHPLTCPECRTAVERFGLKEGKLISKVTAGMTISN